MKVAVCLVVKNEAIEIMYWIAWYKSLGFDSFIIYNDFSSDKTEEVILSLKSVVDIRYARNADNYDMHAVRQLRVYNDAIQKYKEEFDWIALFDCDEYLDLSGKNIKEYLSSFSEDVSSIAFNWCCAGTNGFINRPEGAPFLNYTLHGANELFWNRHTKVIFKPKDLLQPIYYVHNAIVSGACVSSDGSPIHWSTPSGGLTENYPTWHEGRLFHYQSRSLEHYVNRYKNLEEIRYQAGDPLHEVTKNDEYNSVESNFDQGYIRHYYDVMLEFALFQSKFIMTRLRSTPNDFLTSLQLKFTPKDVRIFNPTFVPNDYDISNSFIAPPAEPGYVFDETDGQEIFTFYIKNHFSKRLRVKDRRLSLDENADANIIGIYIKGSNVVHLISSKDELFVIEGDPRIAKVLTYKIFHNRDNTFSMLHPRKKRYLGFNQEDNHNVQKLRGLAWESFTSEMVSIDMLPDNVLQTARFLESIDSLQTMKDYSLLNNDANLLFLNVINSLPDNAFHALNLVADNIINEHLY